MAADRNGTCNVNVFTHLASSRMKVLIGQGMAFEDARIAAKRDLEAAFGLQFRGGGFPEDLDLTDGTSPRAGDNAILLIASSSLIAGSVNGRQHLLEEFARDFSRQGSAVDIGQRLRGFGNLDHSIRANLATQPGVVDPPNPEDFLHVGVPAWHPDQDNDGIPDTSDAFPLDALDDTDSSADGTGNNVDSDDNNDGTPGANDAVPDVMASGPPHPRFFAEGKLGIIGPSLAAATHASQMCENADAYDCIRDALGVHSRDWSHAGGAKSWSLASLLGFDQQQIIDVSDDGAEWKDALEQAQQIMLDPQVEAVYIILGGNNVCTRQGHDYTGDLDRISAHIDTTLLFLTDSLLAGGHVYWSGVVDFTQLRRVMAGRDHNYWFEDCQAFWDLNGEKIKDSAAEGICDHFFDNEACQVASVQEEAKDRVMELFVNRLLEDATVEEGPCGKVLSSKSTEQDIAEARQFTLALNTLMQEKAREFDGRNGVAVHYSDNLFSASAKLQPYHISRLDCFHPNRAGQYLIATEVWRGFQPQGTSAGRVFFDEFDNQDYCSQELTTWDTCWIETGREDGGPLAGDVQINLRELRIRDHDKGIMRGLNFEGSEEAWVSFNYRREQLDREADYVTFDISPDAGQTWVEIDRFQGDADDYSVHRGYYYNVSAYATEQTMLRFLGASGLGGDDRVYIDNVQVMSWGPPSPTGNE